MILDEISKKEMFRYGKVGIKEVNENRNCNSSHREHNNTKNTVVSIDNVG